MGALINVTHKVAENVWERARELAVSKGMPLTRFAGDLVRLGVESVDSTAPVDGLPARVTHWERVPAAARRTVAQSLRDDAALLRSNWPEGQDVVIDEHITALRILANALDAMEIGL